MPQDPGQTSANLPQKDLAEGAPAHSSPRLDDDRYLAMIEDMEATEAQKRELLQTLWAIMVSIADLGLGLDPVQMLLSQNSDSSSRGETGPVNSSNTDQPKSFERAARVPPSVEAPGENKHE